MNKKCFLTYSWAVQSVTLRCRWLRSHEHCLSGARIRSSWAEPGETVPERATRVLDCGLLGCASPFHASATRHRLRCSLQTEVACLEHGLRIPSPSIWNGFKAPSKCRGWWQTQRQENVTLCPGLFLSRAIQNKQTKQSKDPENKTNKQSLG